VQLSWGERVKFATTADDLLRIADDANKAVTAGELTEGQRSKLSEAIDKKYAAMGSQEVTA
jgi:hypothetical protein